MGPKPLLWFLHAKQQILDQNYKSPSVPNLTNGFCIQNTDFSTRFASLYWSQPSSVIIAFKTAYFGSELQVSKGPRPHLSFCACKKNVISIRITSLYGSQHSFVVFAVKTATLDQKNKSLWVPDFASWFVNENSVLISRMMLVHCSQTSSVVLRIHNRTLASELLVSMDPSPHLRLLHAKQRL